MSQDVRVRVRNGWTIWHDSRRYRAGATLKLPVYRADEFTEHGAVEPIGLFGRRK
jgi:hypothetical protein